jgi:hypothetical protein
MRMRLQEIEKHRVVDFGLRPSSPSARSAYKHAVSLGGRAAPAGLRPRKSLGNRTRHNTVMRFTSVGKRKECAFQTR